MISIVTVTLNAKSELERTLESLKIQSNQDFEFIVVDGGSSDDTIEFIKANHIYINKFLAEKDRGIYDAMNKGFKLATYKWVLFLNAGDLLYDSTTLDAVILEIMNLDCDYAAIYGNHFLTESNSLVKSKVINKRNLILYGTGVVNHQSVLYNKNYLNSFSTRFKLKGEYLSYWHLLSIHKPLKRIPVTISRFDLNGLGGRKFLLNNFELLAILISKVGPLAILGMPSILLRILNSVKRIILNSP